MIRQLKSLTLESKRKIPEKKTECKKHMRYHKAYLDELICTNIHIFLTYNSIIIYSNSIFIHKQ